MDPLSFMESRKRSAAAMDNDEDPGVVGLMESNNIQYRSSGSNAGSGLSYRVVTTTSSNNEESNSGGGASVATTTAASNMQAVLASPINGQFYVIGSPQEVLSSVGQRSLAPRGAGGFMLDTPGTGGSGGIQRDDRRRATHNEVERRRRDNINNWIMKLSKLIPDLSPDHGNAAGGPKGAQSKGGILSKACEYVVELRETNERLIETVKQNEQILLENERIQSQLDELKNENAMLKQQLQNHGIMPADIKFPI